MGDERIRGQRPNIEGLIRQPDRGVPDTASSTSTSPPPLSEKAPQLIDIHRLIRLLRSFHLKVRQSPAVGIQKPQGELSSFEKVFLAHFDEGVPLGKTLERGKFRFLGKTQKAWAEFFQRFLPFSFERRVPMSEIRSLVYRGLLDEAAVTPEEQRVLVSDLQFLNGSTDKFARLPLKGNSFPQRLAEMQPGDTLASHLLKEWLGQAELHYLSLSHKVVNPDAVKEFPSQIGQAYQSPYEMKEAAIRQGTREASQGIALDARTEQMIAEKLDLRLKPAKEAIHLDPRANRETRIEKFKGRPRWYIPLIYFVAASATALFCFYVFKILLP